MIYLATVARETGWSAHYIQWCLPYAMGLGIVHAAGVFHGEIMEWLDGSGGEEARADLRAQLETVRRRHGKGLTQEGEV